MRDTRTEKIIERAGDALMESMGFVTIRFSQPFRSLQTRGIADRLYIHETRKLAVFWEAKRAGMLLGDGRTRNAFYKQTPAQKVFQHLIQTIGWEYVTGTEDALIDWAIHKGLCRRSGLTIEVLR